MLLLVFQLLLQGAYTFPAIQNSTSCAHDELYTSLSKDGQEFCAEMIKTQCDELITPTQFTSYPSTQLYSYCKCIATSCTWERTNSPTATNTGSNDQDQATSTVNKGSTTPIPTSTSPQARSSPDGHGNGGPTNSNGSNSGTVTRTKLATSTTPSEDDGDGATSDGAHDSSSGFTTFTTHPTSTVTGSASSDILGSDSDAVTSTISNSSGGSFKVTTTAGSVDQSSIDSSSVGRGSSGGNGDPTGFTQTTFAISSTDSRSADSTTNGVSSVSSSLQSGQRSTYSQTSDGWSVTHRSLTTPLSPGPGSLASNQTSTSIPNNASSGWTGGDSLTGSFSSGSASPTTGWNGSITASSWVTATGTHATASVSRSSPDSITEASSDLGSTLPASGPASTTTTPTPTSLPFITPSGFNTSTLSHIGNLTQTSPPPLPAANFTQVTRTAAITKPTCYQMPGAERGSTKRALLHNTYLHEQNATIPFPYIESVDFQADGIEPVYLTLRDAAEGTHYIDVSNRSYISIVDSLYNAMIIDAKGIHFSTKSCKYDVSITIDDMYRQLSQLSGQTCSAGSQRKRMNDMDFRQALYLRDQCNNPVKRTIHRYPELKVGDTDCNDIEVDETTGRWLFDCTFPGSDSGALKCQWAVRNDIEDFLFTDPFGGACPDLSTVITTLEANGQDFINPESLRTELYNQGLDEAQRGEADLTVVYYEQLWEILKQAFSKLRTQPPGKTSAIQEYIGIYNQYRNFENDICDDLHAGDMPLKMSLRAGVTFVDAVARLNWAPQAPKPFNITIQDPSKQACCPAGSISRTDSSSGVCSYPFSAQIGNTGCICGKTVSGASIAFEFTECDNFVSECKEDADCAKAGHASYVCLTGSCCGGDVCVDPYECAQNGTALIKTSLF